MPRSQIIADRITEYDKIITKNRTIPEVELAIFKIAICQLVDAAFGGGNGGSATTPQIVADGIDLSVDINTIITRLTSIASNTNPPVTTISVYTPTTAIVGDAGNVGLASNSARKGATIVNRSTTQPVDLFFGALDAFGAGLPLAPQQAYEINSTNLYTGVITAIAPSGQRVNLAVLEGV